MARLKLRIRFNPGRDGAPMDKLGEFSSQTEKFLRSLATDLGIAAKKGLWLASNFKNSSVQFDSEFADGISEAVAIQGTKALELILGDNTLAAVERSVASYGTVAEFSRIGKSLAADEYFLMGVFDPEGAPDEPELKKVTFRKTAELRALLEMPFSIAGAVQGVFHSWHPGADKPFFNLRELSTNHLIHCEYPKDIRAKVHAATEREGGVVLVSGQSDWDKATNQIITLQVSDIEAVDPIAPHEFESLVGIAPNYTGAMTTDEYISWIRGDDE